MRAIRFHRLGPPDVLQLEEVEAPVPGPGEVLVRVRAIGVNWADTHFRKGEYFVRPVFPQIPGMEAAGEVVALGPGTSGVAVGDRVMVLAANAYAELLVARPSDCYPIPDGLDFVRAAALPIQGLTAHHVLGLSGRLVRGERVLVHAAAGGVGTLAVQLARKLGASNVIATASSDDKRALARELGAHVALDARAPDFAKRVKDATAGHGVDLLLEMLGGSEAYKRNLGVLAPLGRMVVYGAASGDLHGTIEPVGLMGKNHAVIGYYLTPLLRRRELCAPALDDLAKRVARGEIRVVIGLEAKLDEAAEVHRTMEGRATTGKVVLVP
jgi:NADPH2:quinone reductase